MFDEPSETPAERASDPLAAAREKFDELRMHAELAAIFEGPRKFGARIRPGLDPELARQFQQTMARLEKSRSIDSPVLPSPAASEAAGLLNAQACDLSTNDYHIHRRPGEAMIVRWLAANQVETLYERFQAHFDVALAQYREEERQSHGWKQDEPTLKYLDALDKIEVKMADRYLREAIRAHKAFVLSTQTADEIDILHLCDYVMGVDPSEVVGKVSAPPDDGATERDRAWFFKLFSLRGIDKEVERMCFFTYLQKADESAW